MTSKEIEINIIQIFEKFSEKEFIFELLMAYGISKTSITRLKKGDYNLSKCRRGDSLQKESFLQTHFATIHFLFQISALKIRKI